MIHSVEKRKKRKDGKLVIARCYSLRYRSGDMPCDKWVALGVTDKTVAQAKAVDFFRDLERAQAGLPPLKKDAASANRPVAPMVAEYVAELSTRGCDMKYVKGVAKHLATLAAECRWKKLGDVSSDSFMQWRRAQTLKAKTLNEYLSDASSFLRWLVKHEHLVSNALAKVGKIARNEEEEEIRRAFTQLEFARLCSVSGPRALIYQLTLFTGMRRAEVGQLLWGDVRKDTDGKVFLKLRASTTKNGKEAKQPVPPWLAVLLDERRPKLVKLSDKVFASIPRMPRFYGDLEAAGIPRVDERGHLAVFHSLRHTLGTWLWATGADIRVIQLLMRHADIQLTAKRYTDTAGLAVNDAVTRLPGFNLTTGECTQIGAQISGAEGQNVSQAGAAGAKKSKSKPVENESIGRALSWLVASGPMVRAAGFEPATPSV